MTESISAPDGGRYELIEPIARGAMGAVFRARANGREVAVKQLLERGQLPSFQIEARLLSGLRHPGVVRVIDHFRDGPDYYLVMELVRGPDLARVLHDTGDPGLPLDEVLAIAREAADALEYVHEQQVVHRDVKPRNLIAGEGGTVLVDFGVAREMGEDPGTRGVGTPRYMAPEVMVGEGVSPRSDVYGLAATLWTLLAGEPPAYGSPDPLTAPGVTAEHERALRQALDLRPERRFASVSALAAEMGSPIGAVRGRSLAASLPDAGPERQTLLEAIVRTAAGVFDVASVSVALHDERTSELVFHAAWGTGADGVVGVRMRPGEGIAGAAVADAEPVVVADCRNDERFAAQIAAGIGYVPNTLLAVPLLRGDTAVGVLSVLDRRDGGPFGQGDVARAQLFAELTLAALD